MVLNLGSGGSKGFRNDKRNSLRPKEARPEYSLRLNSKKPGNDARPASKDAPKVGEYLRAAILND
jgi:hypothetical protein